MQSMAEDPSGRTGPLFDSAVRSQLEFALTSKLFSDHQMVRLGRLAQRAGSIGSQLNVSRDGRWSRSSSYKPMCRWKTSDERSVCATS